MAGHRRGHEAGRLEARTPAENRHPRDRQQVQMSAVLYGNLRAEIISNAGVRIQRVNLRQAGG